MKFAKHPLRCKSSIALQIMQFINCAAILLLRSLHVAIGASHESHLYEDCYIQRKRNSIPLKEHIAKETKVHSIS